MLLPANFPCPGHMQSLVSLVLLGCAAFRLSLVSPYYWKIALHWFLPWWLWVKSGLLCFNKYSWGIFLNIMSTVFIAQDGGVIKGKTQTVTSAAVGQFTARVCVNFIILLLPIANEWDTMQYYLSYNKSVGQRGGKHQQMLIIIRGQKYNTSFYPLIRRDLWVRW